MKNKITLAVLCCMLHICGNAQESNDLFSRLHAISNNGVDFFNVDGIEISSQVWSGEFSKKDIFKKAKRYRVKESDLNQSDSGIGFRNFYVTKEEDLAAGLVQRISYYFIEIPGKGIRAVTFAAINKTDRELERTFLRHLNGDSIPQSIYEPLDIVSINFAGRKLSLGSSCRWMGVNNVQCPHYGQMNWSVHKTHEDASSSVENQFKVIQAKKQGKIVSEELVDVIFEGQEVKAKKAVYDFTGVTSLVVGMSGGKTLTIYFVAAAVRQHFVSCVMSFWNNDSVSAGGLPPLLEEVMKLQQ